MDLYDMSLKSNG